MLSAFSTTNQRIKPLLFLILAGLLASAAAIIGIDDNPPGILLAIFAAIAFILAFAHPWRTARKFMLLLLAAVLGFVLFVVLNIIAESIVNNPANSNALQDLIQSPIFEALNLILAMVCLAAFIVGAVGSLVMFIRSHWQTR